MSAKSEKSAAITKLEQVEDHEFQALLLANANLKKPSKYRVVLGNNEKTPPDFILWVLGFVFYKDENESSIIAGEAFSKGKSIIGVYTYDIAATKVAFAKKVAEEHNHTLQVGLESLVVGQGLEGKSSLN